MNVLSSESTVSFRSSFEIAEIDHKLPPGVYKVVTDQEEILGVSFLAYRRLDTRFYYPSLEKPNDPRQSISINPIELEAALMKDRQLTI